MVVILLLLINFIVVVMESGIDNFNFNSNRGSDVNTNANISNLKFILRYIVFILLAVKLWL